MHGEARLSRRKRVSLVALVVVAVVLVAGACDRLGGSSPTPSRESVAAGFTAATVERVVDGDTAIFRLEDGARERVRFIGVDTPESTTKHEPFGEEASAYTKGVLVPGRSVLLERDAEERDRYGRLLAYVWLEEPSAITDAEIRAKMLNAKLALEGYAQQMTIPPNVKHADRFRRYVAEARSAQRGLWAPGAGE
jgi:micrococcal nuclease